LIAEAVSSRSSKEDNNQIVFLESDRILNEGKEHVKMKEKKKEESFSNADANDDDDDDET